MHARGAGSSGCNKDLQGGGYISKDVIFLYTLKFSPFSDDCPLTADANQSSFPLTMMLLHLSPLHVVKSSWVLSSD